jgi:hypothetical protein
MGSSGLSARAGAPSLPNQNGNPFPTESFLFPRPLSYSFWIDLYPGSGIGRWVSGENRLFGGQVLGMTDFIASGEMGMKWGNRRGFTGDRCGVVGEVEFFTKIPNLWPN